MTAANAAKAGYNQLILLSGAPEGIRTPDLCLRRTQVWAYPTENPHNRYLKAPINAK
jgi:hypothetical protein